jgi:fido (protein-threonine AMPylation protein)
MDISFIKGNFDFANLKNIHRFLFEDIYEWAGEERSVNLKKTQGLLGGRSVEYSKCENIAEDVDTAIKKMKSIDWSILSTIQQSRQLANATLNIWRVHPFRDGNTRATISFMKAFAASNNIMVNISKFEQDIRNSLVLATAEPYCVSKRLPSFIQEYPQALLYAEFQNAVIQSDKIKTPSFIKVTIEELKNLQENDIPFYFLGDQNEIIVKCDISQENNIKSLIEKDKNITTL